MSKPHDYGQNNIGDRFGNLELTKIEGKVWTLRCGCKAQNIVTVGRAQIIKADGKRSCGKCGYRKRKYDKDPWREYSYDASNVPGYFLHETRTVNGVRWQFFRAVMP